jgi:hypothetical protein
LSVDASELALCLTPIAIFLSSTPATIAARHQQIEAAPQTRPASSQSSMSTPRYMPRQFVGAVMAGLAGRTAAGGVDALIHSLIWAILDPILAS